MFHLGNHASALHSDFIEFDEKCSHCSLEIQQWQFEPYETSKCVSFIQGRDPIVPCVRVKVACCEMHALFGGLFGENDNFILHVMYLVYKI